MSASSIMQRSVPRLKLFRALWGSVVEDGGPRMQTLPVFLQRIRRQGFTGIECSVGMASTLPNFAQRLQEQDLEWIPVVVSYGPLDGVSPFLPSAPTAGPGSSWKAHAKAWEAQVDAIAGMNVNPDKIPHLVSLTGHDAMVFDDAIRLFEHTEEYHQKKAGNFTSAGALLHETHRGRALYSPWVAQRVVQKFPEIQLVADLAHYTCVTEWCSVPSKETHSPDSMRRDMLTEAVASMAPNFAHIHGRIGSAQSPQVPDPRTDRWTNELHTFESWWDIIWRQRLALQPNIPSGDAPLFTFTSEHGPPPYQQESESDANSEQAHENILNQVDDINTWIGLRQQSRFDQLVQAGSHCIVSGDIHVGNTN